MQGTKDTRAVTCTDMQWRNVVATYSKHTPSRAAAAMGSFPVLRTRA